MWIWIGAAVASAVDPSPGLRAVTTTGVVLGGTGAALTAWGIGLSQSPEPVGALVIYPPGVALLGTGASLTIGGTWAQARRLERPATASAVGLGLLGGGLALGLGGLASGDGTLAGVGAVGGPVLATAGWAAAVGQGSSNRRSWTLARARLVPDLRRPGLVLLVGS